MDFVASEQTSTVLKKILASERFVKAERLSTLLSWIVEKSVQGEVTQLKESVITEELFKPMSTGFVRNLASRLRVALAAYYGTVGAGDLIVVSIPPGHYRAVFQLKQSPLKRFSPPVDRTSVPYQAVSNIVL